MDAVTGDAGLDKGPEGTGAEPVRLPSEYEKGELEVGGIYGMVNVVTMVVSLLDGYSGALVVCGVGEKNPDELAKV